MRDNEKQFSELKHLQPLSSEARNMYDQAYEKILSDKNNKIEKKKWRNSQFLKPSFVLSAILILGVVVSFSPIGKAFSDYLRFGGSNSRSLNKSNFVTKQGKQVKLKMSAFSLNKYMVIKKKRDFIFLSNCRKTPSYSIKSSMNLP